MSVFRNKVVLITGASAGIGRETALAFAGEGASVALVARRADRLSELADRIEQQGGKTLVIAADIADADRVRDAVEKTVERFGRIDILVNNAGVGTLSSVADMSRDELDQVMNVNFFGLVECVQQVLPYMIRQGSGQIINISSIVGKRAIPRMSAYCASKFAVQGFSEALRVEVAPHNIDVTVICPPRTQTEFGETPMMRRPGNRVNLRGIPAERVARVILKAARRRRREVIISLSGKALAVAAFFFPGLLDWFFVRLWSRLSGSSGSPS